MLGPSGILRALIRFDDVRAEERCRGATCAASGPASSAGRAALQHQAGPGQRLPAARPGACPAHCPAGEREQHRGAGASRTRLDWIGPTVLLCSSVIYFVSSNFNTEILDVGLFWGKLLSQCTVKHINVEVLTGHFSFSIFLYAQMNTRRMKKGKKMQIEG